MRTPYLAATLTATALLMSGFTGTPVAVADEPSPLYTLVDTAAQRLLTADPVAAYKWISGGPITDPPRVAQVLDGVSTQATEHQLDPQYVRQIFADQINATEGVQFTRFGQWKFDPGSAPASAPDLSVSRTAIDGYNRTMVNEIAAQRDTLQGPGCAAALDGAAAAVIGVRALDPLYQQALAAATGSYCG